MGCQEYKFLFWSKFIAKLYTQGIYVFNFAETDRCNIYNQMVSKLGKVDVDNFVIVDSWYADQNLYSYKTYKSSSGTYTTEVDMSKILRNLGNIQIVFKTKSVYYFKFKPDLNEDDIVKSFKSCYLQQKNDNIQMITINKRGVINIVSSDQVPEIDPLSFLLKLCDDGCGNYFHERCERYGYSSIADYYCSYIPEGCEMQFNIEKIKYIFKVVTCFLIGKEYYYDKLSN